MHIDMRHEVTRKGVHKHTTDMGDSKPKAGSDIVSGHNRGVGTGACNNNNNTMDHDRCYSPGGVAKRHANTTHTAADICCCSETRPTTDTSSFSTCCCSSLSVPQKSSPEHDGLVLMPLMRGAARRGRLQRATGDSGNSAGANLT